MRGSILRYSVLLLFGSYLHAQSFTTSSCDSDEGNTNNHGWFSGHQTRVCELRRITLPLVDGQLSVLGKNGDIELIGENRTDVALEARVLAQASSREEAKSMLREIKIATTGTLQAEGPRSMWSARNWSVNYRLRVPRRLAAHLHSENGGINVSNVDGEITADTINGGLVLRDLAGQVHANTVNGGLEVALEGTQWRGSGLTAKSTNGGITVKAPEGYSAHLVAETVNGGVHVAFPITMTGTIKNHVDADIGRGGATLQFQTVNGGVHIERN